MNVSSNLRILKTVGVKRREARALIAAVAVMLGSNGCSNSAFAPSSESIEVELGEVSVAYDEAEERVRGSIALVLENRGDRSVSWSLVPPQWERLTNGQWEPVWTAMTILVIPSLDIPTGGRVSHEFPVDIDVGATPAWTTPVTGEYRVVVALLSVRKDDASYQLTPALRSPSFVID